MTRYAYDARNQRIRASDPLSYTQQLFYTPRGELDHTIDALGRVTTYTYNALGQPVRVVWPDETVAFEYDAGGRRTVLTDTLGITQFAYDPLGRIQSVTDPFQQQLSYGYDAAGNRTTLTYPGGRQLTYTYDTLNRLTQVLDGSAQVAAYSYNTANRLEQITRSNGASTNYSYDRAGQVRETYASSGTTLARFTYTYNPVGDRKTSVETLPGSTTALTATYDPLGRLTGALSSTGAAYTYSYDAAGNRVQASGPTGTISYTYDATNRISSANGQPYTWDANGNLLSDGTHTYAYNAAGRLTSLTQGGTALTYRYNGDGVILARITGGVETHYTQDLAAPISQIVQTTQGSVITDYLYGHERLAAIQGGTRTWYVGDALGSLRATLNDAGTVLNTLSYDPWGAPQAGSIASFGFGGELQEGANGLVHLRARWYHAGDGAFITRDPFAGFPDRPYSQHPYQYGYSNPLRYTDPTGAVVDDLVVDEATCTLVGGNWNRQDMKCENIPPLPPKSYDFPRPMHDPVVPTQAKPPRTTRPPQPTTKSYIPPTPVYVYECDGPSFNKVPGSPLPRDTGYIEGGSINGSFLLATASYAGERVYDLYDFEYGTFVVTGGGYSLGTFLGVGVSAYYGDVTGWSTFLDDKGVENYSGAFISLGASVNLPFDFVGIGAQSFASPNLKMYGSVIGPTFGADLSPLPGSISGTTSFYILTNRVAFHAPGTHTRDNHPTYLDALRFISFIMRTSNISDYAGLIGRAWAIKVLLENGRRWEQYGGP